MLAEDVDPRFDPRFQRGYDPVRHPASEASPPDFVAPAEAEPVPKREPAHDVAPTDDVDELPVTRRRDPFATALPILGLVCFAAAGWLAWRFVDVLTLSWSRSFGGGDYDNDWIMSVGPAFSTGLLAAGLFAIIGWLALRSFRRER